MKYDACARRWRITFACKHTLRAEVVPVTGQLVPTAGWEPRPAVGGSAGEVRHEASGTLMSPSHSCCCPAMMTNLLNCVSFVAIEGAGSTCRRRTSIAPCPGGATPSTSSCSPSSRSAKLPYMVFHQHIEVTHTLLPGAVLLWIPGHLPVDVARCGRGHGRHHVDRWPAGPRQ
jgi:hypothetical protein